MIFMAHNSCFGLMIVVLLFAAGSASAASCKGKIKSSTIAYEKRWPVVTYNNDKPTKYLDNLDRKRSHSRSNGSSRAGVTQRKSHFAYEMRLTSLRLSDGSSCMGIKKIKLSYGFDKMKVYVANKYKKQTCQYKAILKHENTHVKINEDILEEFSKQFRKNMKSKIDGMNVQRGRHLKKMKRQIGREISVKLKSQSELFQKMLDKEHSKIDTPENYKKIHGSC
ncbi:MAG: hypothetical protein V7750_11425 [Sneathiella sp.]